VKHSKLQWAVVVVTLAAILVMGGCKKKVQTPPPPPPPPPSQPTATLSANPTNIQAGQATTLTWQTSNATDVRIDPIGPVDPSGSQRVTPEDSTNYHLTAKGPGGTADATARVTVTATAQAPPPAQVSETEAEMFARNMKDAFFDYDAYTLRPDAQQALQADAAFLKQHPNWKVTIEGHCDERGSTEYNLALGDNRARAARDALLQGGVPASQFNAISFGKEKPFCNESNESCWQQNRRAHFVLGAGASR
jgi:peptidoglycan-associated lipoprotein